jgi:protein SCO1/2
LKLRGLVAFGMLLIGVCGVTSETRAQTPNVLPPQAQGLAVDERLGKTIRLNTPLVSAEGREVVLADYFGQAVIEGASPGEASLNADANASGKPVIMALVYYECPIVCDLVLDRLGDGLNDLDYTVGEDFNLVVVSFDPGETPSLAATRKEMDLAGYNRPKTPIIRDGWAYHVGEGNQVRAMAESIGFRYREIAGGEYSHPVVLMVLSPEGVVTRYIYGYDYPARDLKLALIEASEGTIKQSLGDRLLAFCYTFDPTAGTYTMQAWRLMQLGGAATLVLLSGFVGAMFITDRVRGKAKASRALSDSQPTTPSSNESNPGGPSPAHRTGAHPA